MLNQTYTQINKDEFLNNFQAGKYPMLEGNGTENDFENIITFKHGIPGFEFLSRFIVVPLNDFPPFKLLQSLEAPEVAMIILQTKFMDLGEEINVSPEDLRKIQIEKNDDFDAYVILKISNENNKFTANTKAPIIINNNSNLGMQVILDHPALNVQHPLELK